MQASICTVSCGRERHRCRCLQRQGWGARHTAPRPSTIHRHSRGGAERSLCGRPRQRRLVHIRIRLRRAELHDSAHRRRCPIGRRNDDIQLLSERGEPPPRPLLRRGLRHRLRPSRGRRRWVRCALPRAVGSPFIPSLFPFIAAARSRDSASDGTFQRARSWSALQRLDDQLRVSILRNAITCYEAAGDAEGVATMQALLPDTTSP